MLKKLVEALYEDQTQSWELAKNGFESLKKIQRKELITPFGKHVAQINPARIRSSGAKVDTASIAARPCFLCPHSLPDEQRGIVVLKQWVILLNPFPILEGHLTIPLIRHERQELLPYVKDMCGLALSFRGTHEIYFNGAKAGASAPDHMHFQAAPIGQIPLTSKEQRIQQILLQTSSCKISIVESDPRKILRWQSKDRGVIEHLFEVALRTMQRLGMDTDLLNVVLRCDEEGEFVVDFIMRGKHRPECFFDQGPEGHLISPGVIDMAGVSVLVRPQDFESITPELWEGVLREVSLSADNFEAFINELMESYHG